MERAPVLAEAYRRAAGSVRFELVTRAIRFHLGGGRKAVLDIGGGYGEQAIRLARLGHKVTILDCDPHMLHLARSALEAEVAEVAARVRLIEGDGSDDYPADVGTCDLICCHSVLMYQPDPRPMLANAVAALRSGGIFSMLALNSDAIAMRAGLRGEWAEACASLVDGRRHRPGAASTYNHDFHQLVAEVERLGVTPVATYGVGIFTDHIQGTIEVEDPEAVITAEWLAGLADPYRAVARCLHFVGRRA